MSSAPDQSFLGHMDVRLKDGILSDKDVLNCELSAGNGSQGQPESMDSLSAINPNKDSPDSSNAESATARIPRSRPQTNDWNANNEWWTGDNGFPTANTNRPIGPRNVGTARTGRSGPPECYNCHQIGHVSRDCLQPNRQNPNRQNRNQRNINTNPNRRQPKDNWNRSRMDEPVWDSTASWPTVGNDQRSNSPMDVSMREEPVPQVKQFFPELPEYYLNTSLSDVTFTVDGQPIPGHRFVLAAKSTELADLLYGKNEENEPKSGPEVEITDTTVDAFKVLLKFVYFGDLEDKELDLKTAIDALKLSKRFQIKTFSAIVEKKLISCLKVENLIDLCRLSIEYETEDMSKSLAKFVEQNEKQIVESKAFLTDSVDIMAMLLKLFRGQKSIITALLAIRESELQKDLDLGQFKELINLDECSVADIDLVRKVGLFDADTLFDVLRQKYEKDAKYHRN